MKLTEINKQLTQYEKSSRELKKLLEKMKKAIAKHSPFEDIKDLKDIAKEIKKVGLPSESVFKKKLDSMEKSLKNAKLTPAQSKKKTILLRRIKNLRKSLL